MPQNNNIEDFFNNAMDGFHEEPSDRVWDGVAGQLERDKSFWRKPLFWVALLALLLTLGGFWAYHSTMQRQVQGLLSQNTSLQQQQLELTRALNDCANTHKGY